MLILRKIICFEFYDVLQEFWKGIDRIQYLEYDGYSYKADIILLTQEGIVSKGIDSYYSG